MIFDCVEFCWCSNLDTQAKTKEYTDGLMGHPVYMFMYMLVTLVLISGVPLISQCFTHRLGEEVTGPSTRGEEGDSLPRGRARHRGLVPGTRRPTHEGNVRAIWRTLLLAVCYCSKGRVMIFACTCISASLCVGVHHSKREGTGLCHVSTKRAVHSHYGRGAYICNIFGSS